MATPFATSVFPATHNSYSGGERHSVRTQLDGGVRLVELDLVNAGYGRHGYRVGHGIAGLEVMQGKGNPEILALKSWLAVIASWSADNSGHAPITALLDPKADLTEPDSFADGNLAALNSLLDAVFGDRLFRADTLPRDQEWPTVEELSGQIVCVLSGNTNSRRGYVSDGGREPSVALDDSGRVIELHASDGGDLWYWSGRRSNAGVTWTRHGKIGAGRSPAVAIAGDGSILAVHGGGGALSYRIGKFTDDALEVEWQPSRKAAPRASTWPAPTVRFVEPQSFRMCYETDRGRVAREGKLASGSLTWDSPEPEPASPVDAAWTANRACSGSAEVTVAAVPRQRGDDPHLLYGTERGEATPIAYEQLLFVEGQWVPEDGENDIAHGRRFVATAASPSAEGQTKDWQQRGKLVRLWGFNEADAGTKVVPNFPATDHPDAEWYRAFLATHGAV